MMGKVFIPIFWTRTATAMLFTRSAEATENARHESASKNQFGLRKKMFIKSKALRVFHIAEPFITAET